ncbi:MAG: signal peptidase II [Patescibacteria group bacterium]|jgi:signal peptidase II
MREWIIRLIVALITTVLLVSLDQWTKALAGLIKFWNGGGLRLVWYENPGIAFSINLPMPLAGILMAILLLVLLGLWLRARGKINGYQLGLLLAIGGGASNLWDKIQLGFVRDFISLWWLPIFNLADVCIFIGVIMIILGVIYGERHQKI